MCTAISKQFRPGQGKGEGQDLGPPGQHERRTAGRDGRTVQRGGCVTRTRHPYADHAAGIDQRRATA